MSLSDHNESSPRPVVMIEPMEPRTLFAVQVAVTEIPCPPAEDPPVVEFPGPSGPNGNGG